MEQVAVYDNEVVLSNPIAGQFLTTLADVCVRDYGRDYGFPNEVNALDLDAYETAHTGSNDKTMDAAIGIADHIDNRSVHSRLLLVELRLKYGGQGQNAKTSDMKLKDAHSRAILSGSEMDVRSFFIFDENVAAPRRNSLAREKIADSSIRKWEILTPTQFLELFKFVEELPYQPITKVDQVRSEADNMIAIADYDSTLKLIRHWIAQEQKYFVQYKLNECSVLLKMISEILDAIKPFVDQFETQETELDFLICEEEFDKALLQFSMIKK